MINTIIQTSRLLLDSHWVPIIAVVKMCTNNLSIGAYNSKK